MAGAGKIAIDGAEVFRGGFLDEDAGGDVAVVEEEVEEAEAGHDAGGGDAAAEGGVGVVLVGGERGVEGDGGAVPGGDGELHGAREGDFGVEMFGDLGGGEHERAWSSS